MKKKMIILQTIQFKIQLTLVEKTAKKMNQCSDIVAENPSQESLSEKSN